MSNPKLEVIAFDLESCRIAQQSGADRIELCDNPADGGTTPSYGTIKSARAMTTLDLFIMIRPRGGDFLYSEVEFETMKEDVKVCKELGCDGVVAGMLTKDGDVDVKRMSSIVNLAYPMSVTFHRAFDRSNDPFKAMEDIIKTGCERILTSGQQPTAMEGAAMINELINKADERIIIMPGSGIRSNNINEIAKTTNAKEFHSSARISIDSKMEFNNLLLESSLKRTILDGEEAHAIRRKLNELEE
jgi:copper homeostasis protein